MLNTTLAPIILFAYNRPQHTLICLEAIKKNVLADSSLIYIFCDGPKNNSSPNELEAIKEVRSIVRSQNWCAQNIIVEREENWGLANSIKNGTHEILNKHGKAIILEDDIVTSRFFLKFMNEALAFYENTPEVMHISGYMFPINEKLPETFFLQQATCWGWGTWKRAWDKFTNFSAKEIKDTLIKRSLVEKFNLDGNLDFIAQLDDNIFKAKKTWAIFWYSTIFLNNGIALHPRASLTLNIGHDGSGENCVESSSYFVKLNNSVVKVNTIPLIEDVSARRKLGKFFRTNNQSFLSRLKIKIVKEIKRLKTESERRRIKKVNRFLPFSTNLIYPYIFKGIDSASFLFQYNEIFESEIYKFRSTSDKPNILDCGSNIGISILYFKKIYPNASIIGFECDQKIFETLKENIDKNNLKDVTLIPKAVWIDESEIPFISNAADGGRMDLSANKQTDSKIVQTVNLRQFLNTKINFLKIDIEGAEVEVLKHCHDLLINVDNLFVEFHSYLNQPQRLSELLSVLEASGFRYYISHIGVSSIRPFWKIEYWETMDNQLNIFAYRE